MKGAGNPSPVWEKGRDEGLPFQKNPRRRRCFGVPPNWNSGGPSPPPLSHPGEGFPALFQ
jgi:hypothetical protein